MLLPLPARPEWISTPLTTSLETCEEWKLWGGGNECQIMKEMKIVKGLARA